MQDSDSTVPNIGHLFDDDEFVRRHIGCTDIADISTMLRTVGVTDLDELIDAVVPNKIRSKAPLDLPAPRPEWEVTRALRTLAALNRPRTSLIGMGYTNTITPAVIRRNLLENPAWYTSYTPYQPEISQGRLESLLNFQTLISDLTGLSIANASLLDEATAAAEAMTMARRSSRSSSSAIFVHEDTHPQTIAVMTTRAEPLGITLHVGSLAHFRPEEVFAALFSYPTSTGAIIDLKEPIAQLHRSGALAIIATDPLACVLLESPGTIGADIAIGSAQRFGVPLGFGGPHAAFMATTQELARMLPGRLIGVSKDAHDRPALRLALQTREQHIRREKATSNICTAQALLANVAAMYAIWHGPQGLQRIARRVHALASLVASHAQQIGLNLVHSEFFDTICLSTGGRSLEISRRFREANFDIRVVSDDVICMTFDETSDRDTVDSICQLLSPELHRDSLPVTGNSFMPRSQLRADAILTAEVFHRHRSEHEMLRYLRRLSDRDLALDRTMIPLGSCTMKLNAAVEMEPITWPEFANVHPFAPRDEWEGYQLLIEDVERMLVTITGYDAVSLQPNAGSQGEFAGLMAIRAFHASLGETDRNICLIPESAHGTNAASAVMAGMQVVVVRCDDSGNVDVEDVRERARQAGARLAAIMITYPSTHGVFEEAITDICDIVHSFGGQVYVDGANLNALVGIAAPGHFGADVSHLNLHKTFCIPHGGGGPGVGPVAVKSHLAPFLPGHPLEHVPGIGSGPVSAAPFGSAGILPIPWAYITLMGAEGLEQATRHAILSANYVAKRLASSFPILYTGPSGFVAHECIIDIRQITKDCGVTVDDVAKRLIDYGFHSPTMSFPVAGTLMIEPTESESLQELDRFCTAMESIRSEIEDILDGRVDLAESPLRNAPHSWIDVSGVWDRPYSIDEAFPAMRGGFGYLPPVNRIDAAFGDRNLQCTCAPISSYADSVPATNPDR
jgi:glycine dehydrogenase